ncbi:LPXTG cell wall anchor domain-containing protein [Bacillaceae bacterium SIJ1]|uniref:SpaA isopeptide-forming pilin-related protein n=1 Tax=Litoribacterium kuwaitense TaxID=1398745 RepID=UPI0013EA1260|nr:SpaA isopeptide-forming pilin-related protein [Litoribacterium kuwaitense]NGP46536.1 LPXTG cell wall anchor domain-containing protein [Litoribacterium kuwaitense]
MRKQFAVFAIVMLLMQTLLSGTLAPVAQAVEEPPATETIVETESNEVEDTSKPDDATNGNAEDSEGTEDSETEKEQQENSNSSEEGTTPENEEGEAQPESPESDNPEGETPETETPETDNPEENEGNGEEGTEEPTLPEGEEGNGDNTGDPTSPEEGTGEGDVIDAPEIIVPEGEEDLPMTELVPAIPMVEMPQIAPVSQEITEDILTGVGLWRGEDENGTPIGEDESIREILEREDPVFIKYTFELPENHGYAAGSTYTFELPEEFNLFNEVTGDLGDYGDFVATPSDDGPVEVVLTFNENIEGTAVTDGFVKLKSHIRKDLDGEAIRDITFPALGETEDIPVIIKPEIESSIDKEGKNDRDYNASKIIWTVDFNKKLDQLTNASLKDILPEGTSYQDGSLEVYELIVNIDGSVEQGDVVTSNYAAVTNGQDLSVDFGDIETAYRVVYVTDITDEGTEYTNDVTLTSENVADLPASATVTTTRGKALEKEAIDYDKNNQTITWEIRYNFNEKIIPEAEAILNDRFTDSHHLIEDSLEVFKVDINEDGDPVNDQLVPQGQYTLTPIVTDGEKEGFNLQFNQNISNAYKIIYKTEADNRVIESGDITNEVTYKGETVDDTQPTGQVVGKKRYSNVDYENKTLKWHVTINSDLYEMKNLEIKDTFTNGGLTLHSDTIVIKETAADGVTYNKDEHYTLIEDSNGFTIRFLDHVTIDKELELSYTTDFDYEDRTEKDKHYLYNQVVITWDGGEVTTGSKFEPNPYTLQNGYKYGSYNAETKEITWTFGVNYNLQQYNNAVVSDEILGNQQLIDDSIKVYQWDFDNDGKDDKDEDKGEIGEPLGEDQYEIRESTSSEGNPVFEIHFKGSINNSAYKVQYKTELADQLVEKTYHNTAVLKDDDEEKLSVDASVSVDQAGKYVEKSGEQVNDTIHWTVNLNYGQSTVSNVQVTDTIAGNQIFLEDSFKLFKTNVAPDETVTKGEELVEGEDYFVEVLEDNSNTFTLIFSDKLEPITRPYILEYKTFINAAHNDELSNNAEFFADDIQSEYTSSEAITVKFSSGSGGAEGRTKDGTLKVKKVDSETNDALSGVEFGLYNQTGEIQLATATTDDNGIAEFKELYLDRNYAIKELSWPEGYHEPSEELLVVDMTEAGEDKVITKTVKNDIIKGKVVLTKVDSADSNVVLKGAEYTLRDEKNEAVYKELSTDSNGKLEIDNLRPGKYKLIETKAPTDYELDQTPIEFEITFPQTGNEIVTKTHANTLIPGDVKLVKYDTDTNERIKGAIFELQDAVGNKIGGSYTTDEDGVITVTDLPPGNYQFEEIEPAFGYDLPDHPFYSFTIKKDQEQELVLSVPNNLTPGSVLLSKVQETNHDEPVEGATFSLFNSDDGLLLSDLKTNEFGQLSVKELKPGKYYFLETDAPTGYILDETRIDFEIVKGQEKYIEVHAYNDLIRGTAELVKVDENDETKTLEDAMFDLETQSGALVAADLTTDSNGTIVVEDLLPGDYQWVETDAPSGYQLNEEPIKFTLEIGDAPYTTVTAENEKNPSGSRWEPDPEDEEATLRLVKVDEDDRMIQLAGAEFDLVNEDGDVVESDLVTDNDGRIRVTDLEPGDYQWIEKKAPEGYVLDDTPIDVEVGKGETETVFVENEKANNRVELQKVDADDRDETLAGAVFDLQTSDGDTVKEDLETDRDGILVVDDLATGDYQFVETKAPEGYVLDTTPIEFTVSDEDTATIELTVENEKRDGVGGVQLTKVDADDEDQVLSGATFVLKDENGDTLSTHVTDRNGHITVDGLEPGSYTFTETEAPEGYVLDDEAISFDIEENQSEFVEVTAYNTVDTTTPVEPENPEDPGSNELPSDEANAGDDNKGQTDDDDSNIAGAGDTNEGDGTGGKNVEGELLPNTATNSYNWMLAGLISIALGGTAMFLRRRRMQG